jgi:hypothetical protein
LGIGWEIVGVYTDSVATINKKPSYGLRGIFKALSIGTGLILFWRGMWGFLDIYLFPDKPILSYITSAVLGFIILFVDDFRLDEIHYK